MCIWLSLLDQQSCWLFLGCAPQRQKHQPIYCTYIIIHLMPMFPCLVHSYISIIFLEMYLVQPAPQFSTRAQHPYGMRWIFPIGSSSSLWIIQNSGDPLDGWILQVLAGKSGSESLGAQRGDKCLDRLDDFSACGEGLEKNWWYALDGYDSFVLYMPLLLLSLLLYTFIYYYNI